MRQIHPTQPTPTPTAVPVQSDWPMQDGNAQRNGLTGAVGLSSSNASALVPAWLDTITDDIQASPVVAGGKVFIATFGGSVIALDATTGAQLWEAGTAAFQRGTPSVDGTTLIVPEYDPPGLTAFNTNDGTVLWKTTPSAWGAAGALRGEPLILNSIVYVDTAGGDPSSGCHNGTVAALSELTGTVEWSWSATSSGDGIGIWSPISLNPTNGDIVFGTGNACTSGQAYQESAISLNAATGAFDWEGATSQLGPDVDVGGGIAESGVNGFFTSKDGNLYAVDLDNGAALWHAALGSMAGFGSIATPATDGSDVVTQSGAIADPNDDATPGSYLYDFSPSGAQLWKQGPFQVEEMSSPAITSDVVVVGVDDALEVRSLKTGALLWSYDLGSFVYASPAVVPGAIYVASYGTSGGGAVVGSFVMSSGTSARTRTPVRRTIHATARAPLHAYRSWSAG